MPFAKSMMVYDGPMNNDTHIHRICSIRKIKVVSDNIGRLPTWGDMITFWTIHQVHGILDDVVSP